MKKVLFASLAVALLVVAGCDKTVPVTVTNSLGDWAVSAVYIYPTTQVSRGEDLQLADLAPDSSAIFRVLPGTYNILILDEDGASYIYDNVTIPAGGYTVEVTLDNWNSNAVNVGTGHYPLVISNTMTDYDIFWLYVDPVGTTPTTEYMGSEILYAGGTATVWLEPGDYAVQAEDDAGYLYTFESVTVGETGGTLAVTDADVDSPRTEGTLSIQYGDGECPVMITNGLGDWTIMYAYVSPSASTEWGDDILGSDMLAPGGLLTAWVDAGTYDIMVEDEDGDTYTRTEVEVGPDGYSWEVTLADMDVVE